MGKEYTLPGRRLREIRKMRDLTLAKVAEQLNCAPRTISRYERGEHQPDPETLRRLAEILDVSVDYLLGLTSDPESHKKERSPAPEEIDLKAPLREKTLADALLKISELIFELDLPDEIVVQLIRKAKEKFGLPEGVGHMAAHGPRKAGTLASLPPEIEKEDGNE